MRLPSGLQLAEMSMPRESVTRRAELPSARATKTSVLSLAEPENASRLPSGDQLAPVSKSPEVTSGRIFRVATSRVEAWAPPPSRKLVKARTLPSGDQEGSRLMEPSVSACAPKPSQSATT